MAKTQNFSSPTPTRSAMRLLRPTFIMICYKNSDYYDTSNYDKTHPNYSNINCKVVGKMKDECGGVLPLEVAALRSKMYSVLLPGDKEKSTAKGVKRSHAQKYVKHDQYKSCLVNESQTWETFHLLQSKNHEIKTVQVTKSALSCYDDKRFLLPLTTDTLAYGHRDIVPT